MGQVFSLIKFATMLKNIKGARGFTETNETLIAARWIFKKN